MTQQGARQARLRQIAGGAGGGPDGDLIAAARTVTGIETGSRNEHEIRLLRALSGLASDRLPEQQACSAAQLGIANWSWVGGELPSLLLDMTQGRTALPGGVSFTRASSGTHVNAAGRLVSAGSGVPRFDHDPATGLPKGLLIEEPRTNLILQSQDIGEPTSWGAGNNPGVTFTRSYAAAPDGAIAASRASGTGAWAISQQVSVANATAYTVSCWVRSIAGGNQTFRLFGNGGGAIGPDQVATPSWQRFSYTFTTSTTLMTVGLIRDSANAAADLQMWGIQCEAGSFATSTIPTTTATVTRSADMCSIGTLMPWFNASEGTLLADCSLLSLPPAGANATIVSFDDGTTDEMIWPFVSAGADVAGTIIDGGVTVAQPLTAGYVAPSTTRYALAWAVNDVRACRDGTLTAADTSVTIPTVTTLRLGRHPTAGFALNGHIRRIAYYPTRLSNAQLQGITA